MPCLHLPHCLVALRTHTSHNVYMKRSFILFWAGFVNYNCSRYTVCAEVVRQQSSKASMMGVHEGSSVSCQCRGVVHLGGLESGLGCVVSRIKTVMLVRSHYRLQTQQSVRSEVSPFSLLNGIQKISPKKGQFYSRDYRRWPPRITHR